jgi:predicted HicB family RNase H-like nuclease
MTKRIQIVARIEPDLRKAVARAITRQRTTLNAVVEAALRAYVDALAVSKGATARTKESQ